MKNKKSFEDSYALNALIEITVTVITEKTFGGKDHEKPLCRN